VTDDGAQLYFSSQARMKDADQSAHTKLFRIVETGVIELFVQVERRYPEDGGNTIQATSMHRLERQ
jgi:hypothetical protein